MQKFFKCLKQNLLFAKSYERHEPAKIFRNGNCRNTSTCVVTLLLDTYWLHSVQMLCSRQVFVQIEFSTKPRYTRWIFCVWPYMSPQSRNPTLVSFLKYFEGDTHSCLLSTARPPFDIPQILAPGSSSENRIVTVAKRRDVGFFVYFTDCTFFAGERGRKNLQWGGESPSRFYSIKVRVEAIWAHVPICFLVSYRIIPCRTALGHVKPFLHRKKEIAAALRSVRKKKWRAWAAAQTSAAFPTCFIRIFFPLI